MKLFIVFILFVFIFISNANAQTIEVVNAKTGAPVEGVLLISVNKTSQTDAHGIVKLDIFDDEEIILFQHTSFLKYSALKSKIVQLGKIVLLIEDPVRLEEVVISANRWEQSTTEIPQKIKSIRKEELLHYNPQTTADLVEIKGGVFIQKSQMGGGSPMIRGFSANRILLVVDGIRMNNAIYRSGNLHNVISLDANSIENTEIIFGPGSVIYGSDALGGVMNFSTLRPKLSTAEGFANSNQVKTRYSSANFEKTIHGNFNFGSKKWAALLSTTFTDFDDLRMGSNGPSEYLRPEFVDPKSFDGTDKIILNNTPEIQKYTGYNQFNILGKLRYRPSEIVEINLSAHHSETSDIPRYDRLMIYRNTTLRYGDWYYGPQTWTLFSGQFQYRKKHLFFDRMIVLAGYQLYTESRYDRNLNNPVLNGRQEDLSIFSLNFDFGKTINKQNEFFYGAETYLNHVNSTGSTKNLLTAENTIIPSRYPDDSSYGSVAGYFSYKLNLKKRFIVQAGLRITHTWLNGDFDSRYYNFPLTGFDIKNSAVNGSVGAVWHPTPDWQLNINASTGFRSPNIDDAAKIFDSEPGNVIVPNPDLKPEYARNFEISFVRSYASKAHIELTGFYTHLKNAMVRRDFTLNGQDSILYDGTLSKVEALVNAESAVIFGGNFAFEYLFTNSIRTRHDLTFAKGTDSDDYPVRHVPPTFGSSHLIFENQKLLVDLYISYSDKFDYEQLSPSEQEKPYMYATDENGNPWSPSWWTLNLKSSFIFNKSITLSGGIENLLDKRYRTYSSGIAAPGINLVLSMLIKF